MRDRILSVVESRLAAIAAERQRLDAQARALQLRLSQLQDWHRSH